MSTEEFDFNKDLLKEIATKKDEIKNEIEECKIANLTKQNFRPNAACEIYNL